MSDHHKSQAERILALLQRDSENGPWDWVHLPGILALHIACYTRRIHELRKAGWEIELWDEWRDGQRRTAYRLIGRKENHK